MLFHLIVTEVIHSHKSLLMMFQVKQLKLEVKVKAQQITIGHTILNQSWHSLQVLCAHLARIVLKFSRRSRSKEFPGVPGNHWINYSPAVQ